jgi:hypothetical protein
MNSSREKATKPKHKIIKAKSEACGIKQISSRQLLFKIKKPLKPVMI